MIMHEAAGGQRPGRGPDLTVAVRRALSTLGGADVGVARAAGLSPRRLGRIRRGEARPTPADAEALADALDGRPPVGGLDPGRADLAERVLRMALEIHGAAGADGGDVTGVP